MLQLVIRILVGLSALFTLAVFYKQADWQSGAGVVGFLVWALLPYALLAFASIRSRTKPGNILILIAAILSAAGNHLYWEGFYAHPDAQSGILFVVVPLLQLVVACALLIPLLFLRRSGGGSNPVS